jgi:hypothetical protein
MMAEEPETPLFEVTTAAIADLRPHPRNYHSHPEDQLDHIVQSLKLHGFYRNIVIANDNTILAGHGVVLAAARMGYREVPVRRLDVAFDDVRAMQVLAGDNEIANLGVVDDRALTELLRDLATVDVGHLLGTGFSAEQLAALAMVTRPSSEIADFSEAGEWLGLPGFESTDKEPILRVRFKDEADRTRLLELMGVKNTVFRMSNIWTVWWPEGERDDRSSVKWDVPDSSPEAEASEPGPLIEVLADGVPDA